MVLPVDTVLLAVDLPLSHEQLFIIDFNGFREQIMLQCLYLTMRCNHQGLSVVLFRQVDKSSAGLLIFTYFHNQLLSCDTSVAFVVG